MDRVTSTIIETVTAKVTITPKIHDGLKVQKVECVVHVEKRGRYEGTCSEDETLATNDGRRSRREENKNKRSS